MTTLTQERCIACRADSPRATEEEIAELHPLVPRWDIVVEDGIHKLRRTFRFRNFAHALRFTDAVGELAEAEGHHPLLLTEWGRMTVTWWTHKIRGLHRNDFIMSAKTDRLYEELLGRGEIELPPPPKERETGAMQSTRRQAKREA